MIQCRGKMLRNRDKNVYIKQWLLLGIGKNIATEVPLITPSNLRRPSKSTNDQSENTPHRTWLIVRAK